ncbi:alkaline phosphatase D family protein [Agaribacter flavus]|uniref:Alkaline phosphatase D family protein n=1 Tax=Agaribacter flavus TaxID=1902781 RepID=A0ABV7FU06_9ALTE
MLRATIIVFLAFFLNKPIWAAENLQKIVFGSCAKERMEQPVWQAITQETPDLFLFIGDNQYSDMQNKNGELVMAPVTDIARLVEAYEMLGKQPGYQQLVKTTPIMATWDDHDYGANDAGKNYPLKEASQQAFLDFFKFPKDHPIRKQAGIYHSKIFGQADQRVQIIMLDTRYHRDDLSPSAKTGVRYQAHTEKGLTILGQAQWEWLEQELRKHADIRIIVSSIQLVAYEHGWESWGLFPQERQKMYSLIEKTKAKGVLFLSGDRHLTEISQDNGQLGNTVPYRIWDFTSSGMTDRERAVNETNSFRVGPVYRGTNFGVVEIDWSEDKATTQIHLTSKKQSGEIITKQTLFLGELQ